MGKPERTRRVARGADAYIVDWRGLRNVGVSMPMGGWRQERVAER